MFIVSENKMRWLNSMHTDQRVGHGGCNSVDLRTEVVKEHWDSPFLPGIAPTMRL